MFSKSTEYALRATIFIAQKGSEQNKLGIGTIAAAIDSPLSFTAKIMQLLSKGNKVVSSVRGPNGGFFMTEKAMKLPVRSVLDQMGEDKVLEKCVLGLNKCSETKPCPMHSEYKQIKQDMIRLFETKTIRELAADLRDGEVYIGNKTKRE